MRLCKGCEEPLAADAHPARKWCSRACYARRYNARHFKHDLGAQRGTVGAWAELVAAIDLMGRGFDVYRAVAPHAPFDLVAHKQGRLLRVEVRTGRRSAAGVPTCSRAGTYDLLAIVLPQEGGVVEYEGVLPE